MRRRASSPAATTRAREAVSSARLASSERAIVLNDRSNAPISPTPVSGIRTARSPPATRPAIADARRTGTTIDRTRYPRDDHDEHDRPHQPRHRGGEGAAGGGIGAVLPGRRQLALGHPQLVELGAQRVDALLPLESRVDAAGGGVAAAGGVHDRHRVLLQVGGDVVGDRLGPGVLGGDSGEPFQFPGRAGKGLLRGLPRLEEALVAGEQEAPLAGLQVDDQPLQRASRHQHLLGVPGQLGRVPLVGQGRDQQRERGADEQREQSACEDDPGREPSSRHDGQ